MGAYDILFSFVEINSSSNYTYICFQFDITCQGLNKNKYRNGTNHGFFKNNIFCQVSCRIPGQLHTLKTIADCQDACCPDSCSPVSIKP